MSEASPSKPAPDASTVDTPAGAPGSASTAQGNPWATAPVPAFPGWAAALGPGIVWLALAQGSGELIWWPYVVAKYGLAFLFLLIPACLLQWPLTFEIGRYTLLTGESIWRGFARLHPLFCIPLWILMTLSFLWFGAFASAGGTALAALTGFPAGLDPRQRSLFWAYATLAVFLAALLVSKVLYRFIEKFMLASSVVTVIGLVLACSHPEVLRKLPEFLSGLVLPTAPARPWDAKDAPQLLTAITFAGLGGFWTLFYSYWLREKGAGMAKYAGRITGLWGRDEAAEGSGHIPEDAPGAPAAWKAWLRFLRWDSGIGLFGNIFTTLLTCLLAYALLLPKGTFPEGWNLAVVQSEFFAVRWGTVGRALFLVVAAAFLADTWLTTVDGVARVHAEMTRRWFPRARARSPRWWYYFFLLALTAVTGATMPLAQPGPLILLSAVLGFIGTVSFSIGLWVLNFRWLPERLPAFARPGKAAPFLLGLSCAAYLALAVAYLVVILDR
jgi:hypothetical protein